MAASDPTLEILKPRAEWLVRRKAEAALNGDTNMSQMHFARKGLATEEMAFVAEREKLPLELVRDEVAAGRLKPPCRLRGRCVALTQLYSSVARQRPDQLRRLPMPELPASFAEDQ
jgi:hypothetical protein